MAKTNTSPYDRNENFASSAPVLIGTPSRGIRRQQEEDFEGAESYYGSALHKYARNCFLKVFVYLIIRKNNSYLSRLKSTNNNQQKVHKTLISFLIILSESMSVNPCRKTTKKPR